MGMQNVMRAARSGDDGEEKDMDIHSIVLGVPTDIRFASGFVSARRSGL